MIENQRLAKTHERQPLVNVVPLKAPFVLYIDPSGACNLNCNFCPTNRSDYRKKERHEIMSFELFKKIVDDMEEFEDKVKVVYLFCYGEPLLNPDLFKMARYLKDKNLCREIRTYTNGLLLNPEINQKFVDCGIDLIRISVEGMTEEQYKEISNVKMNYDSFVANIRDLYERSRGKCEVSVRCANVTIKNQEDADRFFNTFNPISDYSFIEDILDDGWPEFVECAPSEEAMAADNWRWISREKGIVSNEGFHICSYPLTHLAVHSNGQVDSCTADWKLSIDFGNVKDKSLKSIWESKVRRDFEIMHLKGRRSEIEFCKNCRICGYDNVDDVADILIERLEKEEKDLNGIS